jgi:hypothetical protein
MLLLILTACKQAETEEDEPVLPDRFEIEDEYIIGVLDEKLNRSDKDIEFYRDELDLEKEGGGEILYGVRNRFNHSICIYNQFVCATVLRGEGCDNEAFLQNTNYYWKWFIPAKARLIENRSTIYLRAMIENNAAENVFLGQLVVWYLEAPGEECPDIDVFSPRAGIEEYGRQDFLLSIE